MTKPQQQAIITSELRQDDVESLERAKANVRPSVTWWHRHYIWWLAILLCASAVAIAVSDSEAMNRWLPETLPDASTYNLRQSGSSGLMEVVKKLGFHTFRWEHPYRELSKSVARGTLVIIAPRETPTLAEMKQIADWVGQGNTLVYADDFSLEWSRQPLAAFGLRVESLPSSLKSVSTTTIKKPIPETVSIDQLTVQRTAILTAGTVLDSEGAVAYAPYKDGRVFVFASPALWRNDQVADPAYKNNYQLLANIFSSSPSPILFDEKAHGYVVVTNAFVYMMTTPVGYVSLQLLIILLVALLSLNQRFGKARKLRDGRRISNLEFIDGLANTFRRAKARSAVWSMMFHPFYSRLCKRFGLPPQGPTDVIAQAWAQSTGGDALEYQSFLSKAQTFADGAAMTDEQLHELVLACDNLAGGAHEVAPTKKLMGA